MTTKTVEEKFRQRQRERMSCLFVCACVSVCVCLYVCVRGCARPPPLLPSQLVRRRTGMCRFPVKGPLMNTKGSISVATAVTAPSIRDPLQQKKIGPQRPIIYGNFARWRWKTDVITCNYVTVAMFTLPPVVPFWETFSTRHLMNNVSVNGNSREKKRFHQVHLNLFLKPC